MKPEADKDQSSFMTDKKGLLQKLLDWLTTIQGILTALIGILVALGTLLLALKDLRIKGGDWHSPTPSPTLAPTPLPSPTPTPPPTLNGKTYQRPEENLSMTLYQSGPEIHGRMDSRGYEQELIGTWIPGQNHFEVTMVRKNRHTGCVTKVGGFIIIIDSRQFELR